MTAEYATMTPGIASAWTEPVPEATITSRVRTLTTVADRYHELVDPMNNPSTERGSGDRLPLTPHERQCLTLTKLGRGRRCTCAYRTVREFERLMGAMRDDRSSPLVYVAETNSKHSVRALRWHVMGWNVDARRVVRHHPKPVKRGQLLKPVSGQEILRDKSGAWVAVTVEDKLQRTPGARRELAAAGLRWIATNWAGETEPELPADVVAAKGKAA